MTKPKQTAEEYQQERNEKKRIRELDDIKELTKIPAGRRYIWSVLQLTGLYQTAFNEDHDKMCYMAGRRDIGNKLLEDLMIADPRAFATMQTEYYSEVKSEENIADSLEKDESNE